ncbi:2'-5'-oligoadenylate synthase 1A-like [Mesocricetus auratus]|uniref:2'-5'-oligoadenylate synthase 1A-like n=1 Tax=Mesocricetus auratus TaxID=10036 RepID=A0ABM2WFY8_MESAU|nr:2'-5'-oligoadenylate synthase 1A-like [Mesocricetus auratus]
MAQRLSCTRTTELDKFIEDQLVPDTRFRAEVTAAIDVVCAFLRERCFRGADHKVKVSKVVKGGSFGKGIELKGRSDANLVVFFSNLTSFEDQLKRKREFTQEIKKHLCTLQQEKKFQLQFEIQDEQWPNSQGLNFKLRSPELQQEVEFDVLPAYDILGDVEINHRPDPEIYGRLIRVCTSLGLEGEFSICFTELQRNFLKDRPPRLKNLIRLVKHWYQLCKEKLREPLPPQYALELLTVYAWEHGSRALDFNTARGFRTVLELVTNYSHLRIYWRVYYDLPDREVSKYLLRQLGKDRPVILDPTDPTRNVAGGNPLGWWLLAGEAKAWLEYPCVRNCEKSPVRSWPVLAEAEEPQECILL